MYLIYSFWGSGQPSKPEGASGCVEFLENGQWKMSSSCGTTLPFICKIEMAYDPNTDKDLGDAKCDPGWSLVSTDKGEEDNRYCYKADLRAMAWFDAEYECSVSGAHLMSIHSEYELKFAQSLSGHLNTWIGGALMPDIGGGEEGGITGGWMWLDGTGFGFTNWADGEPSGPAESEQCLEMWTNAQWNDNDCTKLSPFICQKPASHSFCAVPGPDRQQCGPTGMEETDCIWEDCCWDPSENQCFLPDSTVYCLEQGGTCIPIDDESCNRGIITNDDTAFICPKVSHHTLKMHFALNLLVL